MSWGIFNRRPRTSPNNPPRAPTKMAPQRGQPEPINANFLLLGNHIDGVHGLHGHHSRAVPTASEGKKRPYTAHVDKHVLDSLKRSPSVDNSFYDRFERLDRDSVIGDTAYKEKHVRGVKQSKQRPASGRPASGRPTSGLCRSKSRSFKHRTRSQSANVSTVSSRKSLRSTGDFFKTAMSFDDETKQNTLNNAVRQISPRTVLGANKATTDNRQSTDGRRRPRSSRKSRERSPSCKRVERKGSVSSQSVGSTSVCSSRVSGADRKHRKLRLRRSRSKTRRPTPRPCVSNKENNEQTGSSERAARSESRASRRKMTNIADEVRQRLVSQTINALSPDEHLSVPLKVTHDTQTGSFAYSYSHPTLRQERKHSAPVRRNHNTTGLSAIDAVQRANETKVQENLRRMRELDKEMYPDDPGSRKVASIPRLRMVVAPTPTPLATLVRASSAKMLMRHQYHTAV